MNKRWFASSKAIATFAFSPAGSGQVADSSDLLRSITPTALLPVIFMNMRGPDFSSVMASTWLFGIFMSRNFF